MTCKDSPNATSSPESAAGPTRSDLQDGPTTDLFGQEAAPASRSARQEKAKAPTIPDTSGRSFTGSSPSAALQQSLANRLQQRLAAYGSTEYALTWKSWPMQSGPPICALRASARRISGNDCGGWPTPQQRDHKGVPGDGFNRASLPRTARLVAGWLTPSANDDASGLPGAKMQPMLPAQAKMLGAESMSVARTKGRGALNPALSRWLMGYPPEWDDCAATATLSSRKSRRSS